MLKIRLRRTGGKHEPSFRVIVSDSRKAPTSSFIDTVGFYDPKKHPSQIDLDLEKIDNWLDDGAQPSDTVASLIEKAREAREAEDSVENE